ncbi:STAS domain-containing protein [Calidifontibacillus erzurumensis]|uniref:STAS domain-containing protein n=1 Tax=Calidifontibacillus erzurumensis TaxID=2741433 RepID=A0A8J8KBI8_9BACI|nr:STAS domain-containing protein [Calidifontibacillus erzurumensis]NSL51667.1 STAS domain-containing protein [Calidifontibacillus erzurumensis]
MLKTVDQQVDVLTWVDDITIKNLAHFRVAVAELLSSNYSKLLLNLQGVQYLNSGALGVIADGVLTALRNKKELVIVTTEQSVQEIFHIVKFGSIMKIFDSKEAGLQYYQCDVHV